MLRVSRVVYWRNVVGRLLSYIGDGAFGCVVPDQSTPWSDGPGTRDVDDAASPLLLHLRYHGLSTQEDTPHINIEYAIKLRTRDIQRRFIRVRRTS